MSWGWSLAIGAPIPVKVDEMDGLFDGVTA